LIDSWTELEGLYEEEKDGDAMPRTWALMESLWTADKRT
jgi:hypothetical protein